MNVQYTNINLQLLDKGLNLQEAVVYSILNDRMKSSRRRLTQFFDKKRNDFYVIFTQTEMADLIHKSERTVNSVYAALENKGFITKAKQFDKADKIFLPIAKHLIYSIPAKLAGLQLQKLRPNHLTLSTNIFRTTVNTINTGVTAQRGDKSPVVQESESQAQPQVQDQTVLDQQRDERINNAAMDSLQTSLMDQAGVPEDAAQLIRDLSYNDPKRFYEINGLVFKAKKQEEKLAVAALGSRGYDALRFEENDFLRESFNENIARILINAYKKNRNEYQAYTRVSLQNYFGQVANDWLAEQRNAEKNRFVDSMNTERDRFVDSMNAAIA